MVKNRIQAILPEDAIKKFERQAKLQGRSESNLAKRYIMDGILKDEEKERKK